MESRPRLRTVLLALNLIVLVLPVAMVGVLRLFESELIRSTESELIAQAAVLAAVYCQVLEDVTSEETESHQLNASLEGYGLTAPVRQSPPAHEKSLLNHVPARLDLTQDQVLPPAPSPSPASTPPDPVAVAVGRRMQPILQDVRNMTLAGIRITDYRGIIVASSANQVGLSLRTREEIAGALRGRFVRLLRVRQSDEPTPPLPSMSRGAALRVFVGMPILRGDRVVGAVGLSRTPMELMKALYPKRYYLIPGLLIMFAIVIALSVFTSVTIGRPVKALIAQAEKVSRGELDAAAPLERPVTQEFDRLSKSVAHMALALKKRADYARAFASNVSHAFKTPLASMRGAVELLEDHGEHMELSERRRFLEILKQESERLDRLVQRLMELARAEEGPQSDEITSADEVVEEVAQRFRDDGLTVTVYCAEHSLQVKMHRETLESIVSNLLENARRHAGTDAQVRVWVLRADTVTDRFVQIDVRDNGPGVPEGQTNIIFNPFFSTARDRGGTGLGLSIVRALVNGHGGSITFEQLHDGPRFVLFIPAVP
jgi:signal transduction histidine kinase